MTAIKTAFLTSAVWCCIATILLFVRSGIDYNTWILKLTGNTAGKNDLEVTEKQSRFRHRQPHWAYKMKFMDQPDDIPDDERICFVHVGKTAGSTLACYMGFDYDHCANGLNTTHSVTIPNTRDIPQAYDTIKQMIPPGSLARKTTSMIHRDSDSCYEDAPMSQYLFVVRNPFTRIQSWFEYERIFNETADVESPVYRSKKPLFIDCRYTTLNILGGPKGLGLQNKTLCSRRAFRAVAGSVGYSAHNYFNYEYYYDKVLKNARSRNPRIMVIRTEHLEEDWSSVETKVLGGPPLSNNFTFTHKNKTPKLMEDLTIDDESRQNICQALCNEIQVYKKILQNAENLSKSAYAQSMHELAEYCPLETSTTKCW